MTLLAAAEYGRGMNEKTANQAPGAARKQSGLSRKLGAALIALLFAAALFAPLLSYAHARGWVLEIGLTLALVLLLTPIVRRAYRRGTRG